MSNPSDRVLGTPPTNTSALPDSNPVPADGASALYLPTDTTAEELFVAIGKLRKEARDEINRLIGFLDKTDNYVSRELEDDGDQGDQSYPEGLSRMCEHPLEDSEAAGDEEEPSLGSSGHSSGGPISYAIPAVRVGGELIHDCEGDEHDGAEPENEHGDGSPDDEPSLGWTVDGCVTGPGDDREEATATAQPQQRTVTDRKPLSVEVSYRRFLRGLPPAQRKAVEAKMADGAGVSLVGGPAWGEK